MADAGKAESFTKSYESLSNAADLDLFKSDDLASYMDSGTDEDFFMNKTTEDGTTRQDIIDKTRLNIKALMKQVNLKSYADACKQLENLDKFKISFLKSIAGYKQIVDKYNAKNAALNQLNQDIAGASNFVKRNHLSLKKWHLEHGVNNINTLNQDKSKKRQIIIDNAQKWNDSLEKYRNSVFKVHYDTYDALAVTWYELTRQFERNPNAAAPAVDNRALNDPGAEKDIAEYTANFDINALNNADEQTLSAYDANSLPIVSRKAPGAGSDNTEANFIKRHKRIVMLGEADRNGVKRRYKLDSTFNGRIAKKQFNPQSLDVPQPDIHNDAGYYDPMLAEEMHLDADEKDVYGRYLYSEKTANIVEAKLKSTGEKVHGFYLNGQYVTDQRTALGDSVADKSGMGYYGRGNPNWEKQEKAEKLRTAIRKSPFFQHVNAKTIQFYASYDAEEDLDIIKNARSNEMANFAGQRLDDNNKVNVMHSLNSDRLKGQAICQYIYDSLHPAAGQQANFNADTDPVIAYVNEHHSDGLYQALIYLLSQNDPVLWTTARKLATVANGVKSRTRYKLKYHFPESGNLMRTALLKELAITAPFTSRIDVEDLEGSFTDFTHREAYLEELNNRRGGFGLWLKKNLLNGRLRRIISTTGGELASGVTDFVHAGEVAPLYRERREIENKSDITKETRDTLLEAKDKEIEDKDSKYEDIDREEELWTSYGESVSAFTRLPSFISAGVTIGVAAGTGDRSARDVFLDLNGIKEIFVDAWTMVQRIKKIHKYLNRSQQEKDNSLEDLDHTTAHDIIFCIDKILAVFQHILGLVTNHMTGGKSLGKLEGENHHGNKIVVMINAAIDICRRIAAIVDESFTIHAAHTRIGRIDAESDMVTTALQVFNGQKAGNQSQHELGQAAAENSQTQFLMSLTRNASRKERSQAIGNIVSNGFTILKDAGSFSDDPVSLSLRGAGIILSKTTDFITWCVGKFKYDKETFNDSIYSMLGDKEYGSTPYFDEVLKRETGIVNKEYLVDLARIFMSIDTHALIKNPHANEGEKELGAMVVGTLFGNTRDSNGARKDNVVQTIKLSQLLSHTGFDASSDWRAVLRNSLMKDG